MERFVEYIGIKMSFGFTLIWFTLLGVFSVQYSFSQTYNSGQNTAWTVPTGTTHIKVEAWGAGGRGGSRTNDGTAGGGGGGAYASSILTVTPGQTYYIRVGSGSENNNNPGDDSWFTTTSNSSSGALVLAKGGSSVANNSSTGASGGSYASSIGEIRNNGGRGADGGSYGGGGGGSSAGSTGIGINATNNFGAVGPTGNDGIGGNGQAGNGNGSVGTAPGGGGGGANRTSGNPTGGNGANGRVIITDLTSLAYDLFIDKTVNDTNPLVGTMVTFTIEVENKGGQTAQDVNVLDELSNGFTYQSHNASSSTTYNQNTGVWNIGNLPAGQSRTLTIEATVNVTGNYDNTSILTADKDNRGGSRSTINLFPQRPTTNLQLTKEVNNTMPLMGENVEFTLTAYNAGPQSATNVKVEDVLSFGFTYVSDSGGFDENTGVWNIGNLNNEESAVLTLIAKVNPTGNLYNEAIISGNEIDPNMSDNISGVRVYPMYPLTKIVLPCGITTYNLTNIDVLTTPDGAEISWHTSSPANDSNKIAIPTNVRPGQKYYVALYNTVENCYSSTSEVSIEKSCLITNPMIRQKAKN